MSNGMVSVMEYLRLGISGVTVWVMGGQIEESLWGVWRKTDNGKGGGLGGETVW
jgi:hypothetical protein